MPDVMISIGDREFSVSCQEGEEHYLQAAAKLLDNEASALNAQIGRLPEARMLLMAGLMLADKTAGMDEQGKSKDAKIQSLETELAAAKSAVTGEPQRVEVPVIPEAVTASLAKMTEKAEALASRLEDTA